jgi:hypothetical protein
MGGHSRRFICRNRNGIKIYLFEIYFLHIYLEFCIIIIIIIIIIL